MTQDRRLGKLERRFCICIPTSFGVYDYEHEMSKVRIQMEAASRATKRVSQLQKATAVAAKIKHCNGCGEDLPIEAFSIDRSRKDGRNSRCRKCVVIRWRGVYRTTPCEGCGLPSMNGTCSSCYRFEGLIRNIEEDIILTIPRLLWNARIAANRTRRETLARKREIQAVINSLAKQKSLTPRTRLLMLLEKIANGTQRDIEA